jgi:predicted nucleotidyltransferase
MTLADVRTTYLPKDYVRTPEGLLFAIVAAGIEENRVLGTLRYAPHTNGHRKLSSTEAQEMLLSRFPRYLHFSRRRDVHLHAVPVELIRCHYRPQDRLRGIILGTSGGPIEAKIRGLWRLFRTHDLPWNMAGVTGSVLIGQTRQRSDIDLVFYDRAQCARARHLVKDLTLSGVLEALSQVQWREAWERRGCSLGYQEYLWHERRKGNKGSFEGTKFDIAFVDAQAVDSSEIWRKHGPVRTQASVTDNARDFDDPVAYTLDDPQYPEVVCFTPTYAGQARSGERVEVAGTLEISDRGRRRIVIGSSRESAGQYIRVMRPSEKRRISISRDH